MWYHWDRGQACFSLHALCYTGDRFDGEAKEGRQHGRGNYKAANGMCHEVPVGLKAGFDSVCALCSTGDRYYGEYKEGKRNGRGVATYANGMSHVTPSRLRAGRDSAAMHSALQETDMMASGREEKGTAGAHRLRPMVCATNLGTEGWP